MFQPYVCESLIFYVPECDEYGLFLLSCRNGFHGMEFAEGEINLFLGKFWFFE